MARYARDKFDLALLRGDLAPWAPPVLTLVSRAKVASYPTLEQARKAVDVLSEEGLPTRHVCVVDEASAAPASTPYTYGRAAAQGAAAGAWVGLALGFLSGVVEIGSWHARALGEPSSLGTTPFLAIAVCCALAGALLGALLGSLTHAVAGAASDSEADRTLPPAQYDVLVDAEHAEGARTVLWLVGP